MIPFLQAKIWYAFQGLPIETVDNEDRLPWSKCSVLTNNMMHILQFEQLTETFAKLINKRAAEEKKGVTFSEYIIFIETYLKTVNHKSTDGDDQGDRNSFPPCLESEKHAKPEERIRGYTVDFLNLVKPSTQTDNKNPAKSDMTLKINSFHDYVWILYRTKNLFQLNNQSILNDGFQNIWLIFITYSIKKEGSNTAKIPVVMDLLEAKYWCSRIQELLGARSIIQDIDIQEEITEIDFIEFINMIIDLFKSSNLHDEVVKIALQMLAEEALEGMSIKGPVKVDRYMRYCVLKSNTIMIYNSKTSAANFRTSFVISPDTEIVVGTNKIQLKSSGTSHLTMEIIDIQQFNKWRTALMDSLHFSKSNITNPAIHEALARENTRRVKRENLKLKRLSLEMKLEEERRVRCQVTEAMEQQLHQADKEMEIYRMQIQKELTDKEELIKKSEIIREETDEKIKNFLLEQQSLFEAHLEKLEMIENEKEQLNEQLQATKEEKCLEEKKRAFLEEQHDKAQQMLSLAEDKIVSLKKLGDQLEKALEEERQAKEDEEQVRNATLALLEEELRSKAKLEELLEEQKNTINCEKLKSSHFAEALDNERIRIQQIAEEKEKLAKQLEDSQERMQATGLRVKNLDSKVSKIAENVFGKEDTRIPVSHRGRGFIAEIIISEQLKATQQKSNQIAQADHTSQKSDKTENEIN